MDGQFDTFQSLRHATMDVDVVVDELYSKPVDFTFDIRSRGTKVPRE